MHIMPDVKTTKKYIFAAMNTFSRDQISETAVFPTNHKC